MKTIQKTIHNNKSRLIRKPCSVALLYSNSWSFAFDLSDSSYGYDLFYTDIAYMKCFKYSSSTKV